MKSTIIVYGNCQAGVFADMMQHFKEIAQNFDIHYVLSFVHPTDPQAALSDEVLARCTLVLEQLDSANPLPDDIRQRLPETATIVRFPPIDFNLLWPLNFVDPRNVNEPPDYPFGRFPYGDRIVVELLREGLTGNALWEAYKVRSVARMPNLDRMAEHEAKRFAARDAQADVKVGALVMANYSEVPLFWTINHPTGWLLGRVLGELLYAAKGPLGLTDDPRPKAKQLFSSFEPFGHQHQPIHPDVARQLGLAWCPPDRTFRYFDGTMMTFEQFMRRYIDFK